MTSSYVPSRRVRGAALLAAMITVALVATLATAALWRQWRGVEVEIAERGRTQSAWVLLGALDWGRLILAGDMRQSDVDHLGEPWAVPLAEARLSTFLAAGESGGDLERDAFLSGQITDLQSRLNLMNLVQGSADDQRFALGVFSRLFELLGLPVNELGDLQRSLQAARQGMTGAGGDAPLLPQRIEQLGWLGVPPSTVAALTPYATLLPDANITKVNLNTASAEVLYAALPGLDLAQARQLVALRQQQYFRTPGEALNRVGPAEVDSRWADVSSAFFEIRGRLRLDDVALEEVAAVRRDKSAGQVVPLWRYRTALSVPADAAPR
jgi:general secretion pathway protein K